MGPDDTIFSDSLTHASIIDGCRLSRAATQLYRHADTDHLSELLKARPQSGQRLIVTETAFSMEGDLAPLAEIVALAQEYDAWIMVDEAHARSLWAARWRPG